uniref:EF-hand calcium binding domain 2 n=1 Tax=Mastacembelus armatus TaxID=205130 RepID=A0A3Q3N4B4_9TELE
TADEVLCRQNVHKKIKAAFQAFDYESNDTVNVREIATIIYSLGCFPTQKDIHDFIAQVEEDHTGYVHLEKFLPAMTTVLFETNRSSPLRYVILIIPINYPIMYKRFSNPSCLSMVVFAPGEPFTQEEMDEMLTAFTDHENNRINYKVIISQLTTDP